MVEFFFAMDLTTLDLTHKVQEFENNFADFMRVNHALAVTSVLLNTRCLAALGIGEGMFHSMFYVCCHSRSYY